MVKVTKDHSFPGNGANSYFWISRVSYSAMTTAGGSWRVSYSPLWIEQRSKKGVRLEQRVCAWRCCGFVSVWLLAVDQTSLTPDLLLTAQLYWPHIYPPAGPVGSTQVRDDGACSDKVLVRLSLDEGKGFVFS